MDPMLSFWLGIGIIFWIIVALIIIYCFCLPEDVEEQDVASVSTSSTAEQPQDNTEMHYLGQLNEIDPAEIEMDEHKSYIVEC